jgi:hypothetical protein
MYHSISFEAIFWILADEPIKFVKNTLDYWDPSKILIQCSNWKVWLRIAKPTGFEVITEVIMRINLIIVRHEEKVK